MMANNPVKVSIIVPVYNVELYIEKCVRSLFTQTYKDIEYIFIDDCCTDNSIGVLNSIIEEYKSYNILVLQHEKNKGLPTARNTGLKAASGEYILHCDSDDWLDTTMIEKLVSKAVYNQADVVYCDFYNVYGDKCIIDRQKVCTSYEQYALSFMEGTSLASACNKLTKRSIYEQYNISFPDGYSMLEDFRTIIQVYYYAKVIVYYPEAMYYYVKSRANSIAGSNNDSIQIIRADYLENVKGILNFLKEKDIQIAKEQIDCFKLSPKRNLLIKGKTIDAFKKWRSTFPEANYVIWKTDYPLIYKLLAHATDKEWWFIVNLWILFKYKLMRR